MGIFEVLWIGVGLAMDAFAVSVTNAMTVTRLRPAFAFKQSVMFGVFQAAMPLIGWLVGITFSNKIEQISGWVSFGLLAFIGGKMLYEAIFKKDEESVAPGIEPRLRYLIVLAIATSIDALAVGIAFSCSGVTKLSSVLINIAIIGAETFVICFAGTYLGKKFGNLLGNKAEIFGGIVLILIGLKILIF